MTTIPINITLETSYTSIEDVVKAAVDHVLLRGNEEVYLLYTCDGEEPNIEIYEYIREMDFIDFLAETKKLPTILDCLATISFEEGQSNTFNETIAMLRKQLDANNIGYEEKYYIPSPDVVEVVEE